MEEKQLSHLAQLVISSIKKKHEESHEKKLTVNPVVSKVASMYEKLRNAMEYREEEVILRATIERILKRRLLLGGNAKTTAEPLIRELIWARYLADNEIPESMVETVEESIDLYLSLRLKVLQKHRIADNIMNEWIYHLMSSDIEHILHPNREKEIVSNFMYQVVKEHIQLEGESEETTNAQAYLAVRKSFARDDLPLLRYHLFTLYFGRLTRENLEFVTDHFLEGYKEICQQLTYPKKDKIASFVKKRTAIFFILEDIVTDHKQELPQLLFDDAALEKAVFSAADERYKSIASKVQRAIIRSVIFILFSKVFIAFAIEGTYERIFYGHILWTSLIINVATPPILMVIVSAFIRTPGEDNSRRILVYIKRLLFDEHPRLGDAISIRVNDKKGSSVLTAVFSILWLFAFFLSFGSIIYVLQKLHFNPVSQGIFLFFLAIVSFLSYRIALTASRYTIGEKQNIVTPIIDFFFMPVIRVGRHLTQEISRINFVLILFDFLIETPFKVLFAFFEQWFHFLHAKSEEIE